MTWIKIIGPLRKSLRLILDPRVSLKLKLIPLLALGYVLSPIDVIPDVFLGFGQLDDLALIIIALQIFSRLASNYIGLLSNKEQYTPTKKPIKFEEGVILD